MVTFLLLGAPGADRDARRRARGAADHARRSTSDYEKPAGPRPRGALPPASWATTAGASTPTGAQGSHVLTSMLGAECLALIPAEAEVAARPGAGRGRAARARASMAAMTVARAPLRDPARARRARLARDRAAPRAPRSPTRSSGSRPASRWPSCSRGCRCGSRSTASTPTPRQSLRAGDELALIPPISGGAGLHVRVTEEPLSAAELTRGRSADPGAGADRHLPGRHPRGRAARLRGLPRDGRGADRRDPRRVHRAPRAARRRRRAPGRPGPARRAERGRRRLRRPSRGSVRRAPARRSTGSRPRRRSGSARSTATASARGSRARAAARRPPPRASRRE